MGFKIHQAYETEIYVTEAGYVAIKQTDPMGGDDTTVLLSRHQLPMVIDELTRLKNDASEWADESPEETAIDRK